MANNAKVIFMGTPEFALPSLDALIHAGFDVLAVVTQPDKPKGRGRAVEASPVKKRAVALGIPVHEPARVREPSFIDAIKALAPDFIVVVAYGKILPKALLALPKIGCVNAHASLLPKYRGASPINRAIINGDKETGVCAMLMDEGMDTGPVLLCEKTPIGDDETAEALSKRLSEIGASLIVQTLERMLEGRLRPRAQSGNDATYALPLKKEEGLIDWNKGAQEVKNLVRGLEPRPGAYTHWKGVLIKIHRAQVAENSGSDNGSPGAVVGAQGGFIRVKCGSGVLNILELQPESKRRMSASDFIKGYRLKDGDSFV
ncbi:MAG: methionyl-tRNA formyltransferase [Deltaproteobacteria bacterium]|nr:methionyl-tRNA formyltransferase [Deltaproteobacteria bacterium]